LYDGCSGEKVEGRKELKGEVVGERGKGRNKSSKVTLQNDDNY
jgi:hypothetical protein